MIEPTEREKKLIEYIMFLMRALNLYTMFLAYVSKNKQSLGEQLEEMNINSVQEEMITYLSQEFSLPLQLRKSSEFMGEEKKDD